MSVTIKSKTDDFLTLEVKIPITRDMLQGENNIQNAVNEVGLAATGHLLELHDAEGKPLVMGSVRMTSKGLLPKAYQAPYGEVYIKRHVYQTSKGGAVYCPLEDSARIVLTSTPRFAAQVSRKAAEMAASHVVEDLKMNHNRSVAKNVVQRISEFVATGIQAKEEEWTYDTPPQEVEIATISTGLDGACVLMATGEWRQAMAGTISLYDPKGKRCHTTYIAAAPEHGKETFKKRLKHEMDHVFGLYPNARRIGIADGAADNWEFLEKHTTKQTLDFYHATEYVADVANCLFYSDELRQKWVENRCHQLKRFETGASDLLDEVVTLYDHVLKGTVPKFMKFKTKSIECEDESGYLPAFDKRAKIKEEKIEVTSLFKKHVDTKPLDAFVSYFRNNIEKSRMNYADNLAENLPIGSGVTESACKMIIKARLCQSGMRWKEKGMDVVLSLRCLARSDGKWEQFWQKVNQYGFPKE
ncbi:MAG: ISKra4 family transposase [Pseudanabaena sp.]|jgi:hypothetical protein